MTTFAGVLSPGWSSYLMLCIFLVTVQYTEVLTSSLLHHIYYSLLLHVLATECDHLQGATNFIDLYRIYRVFHDFRA